MPQTPILHAVTGAFGFSGKYIAQRLLVSGRQVVTLTNSPHRPDPFNGAIEARPYHFGDKQGMIRSLRGVRILYNTYWVRFNHTLFQHAEAVRNTMDLFDAARQAGVERIVHVSITNADVQSPLEYFSGKGRLEAALKDSGLSYAIVRPAVLFGEEDILINNIAWALRHLPVFTVFGDGLYHIQPVFVDDLAALMVEQGQKSDNAIIQAIGPEDFTYRELVRMIGESIGKKRPVIGVSPWLGFLGAWAIGKLMRDEFVTRAEIAGLMANTLHVPGAAATGATRLSDWVRNHAATLGIQYHSELARRRQWDMAYESCLASSGIH